MTALSQPEDALSEELTIDNTVLSVGASKFKAYPECSKFERNPTSPTSAPDEGKPAGTLKENIGYNLNQQSQNAMSKIRKGASNTATTSPKYGGARPKSSLLGSTTGASNFGLLKKRAGTRLHDPSAALSQTSVVMNKEIKFMKDVNALVRADQLQYASTKFDSQNGGLLSSAGLFHNPQSTVMSPNNSSGIGGFAGDKAATILAQSSIEEIPMPRVGHQRGARGGSIGGGSASSGVQGVKAITLHRFQHLMP